MKEVLVPIDRAGRIVLPKSVRLELAIQPGDLFKVSVQGLSVTLTPKLEKTGFVRKGKALVFTTADDTVLTTETINEVLAGTRDEREAGMLKPALVKGRRK
jgi:AbrB family looped-hinge helix DNA binding protein